MRENTITYYNHVLHPAPNIIFPGVFLQHSSKLIPSIIANFVNGLHVLLTTWIITIWIVAIAKRGFKESRVDGSHMGCTNLILTMFIFGNVLALHFGSPFRDMMNQSEILMAQILRWLAFFGMLPVWFLFSLDYPKFVEDSACQNSVEEYYGPLWVPTIHASFAFATFDLLYNLIFIYFFMKRKKPSEPTTQDPLLS